MPSFRLHRRDVTLVAAGLVALGGIWAVPRSIAAGDSVTLEAIGPAVLTTDSTYKIMVDGDTDKICRVQETAGRTSDKSAPYALTITPEDLPAGSRTLTFQAVACDNSLLGSTKLDIQVPVHVVAATRYVAPVAVDDTLQKFTLKLKAEHGPLDAVIKRGGKTVATLGHSGSATANWTWNPGHSAAGGYTAEVTSGAPSPILVLPFRITSGWAPLGKPFPRCQILTWSYSAKGQPARAKGMKKDVVTAFKRISAKTGIQFRPVAKKGTIQLGWKDMGANGPDGEGGAFWTGDAATGGRVVFNTRSTWVAKAGFKEYPGDFPGRGALITHEIGHSLGLGHVTDRREVMYPVATNGSPLGLEAGDIAGLDQLYHAKSC